MNYSTSLVNSREAALAALQQAPAAQVILDMIMSTGMNGFETYRRILDRFPEQKAPIASGFFRKCRCATGQGTRGQRLCQETVSISEMGSAIKQVLAG